MPRPIEVWANTIFMRHANAILAKPPMNRVDGDLDRAVDLARRVCDSDPPPTANMLEPRILLAMASSEKGDRRTAIAALEEALYVAGRFRGLDEGRALPGIHWRLSELMQEEGAESPLFQRPFMWLSSCYHVVASYVEQRRLMREDGPEEAEGSE